MISRTTTWRRRLASAALAGALTAGFLAGCSAHPGAAVVIDGKRLDSSELAAVQADMTYLGSNAEPATLLTALAQVPAIDVTAKDNGLAVSDDEAVRQLQDIAKSQKLDAGRSFAAGTIAIVRSSMEFDKIKLAPNADQLADQAVARIVKTKVTVNPRFGTWDKGQVQPEAYPWVAQQASAK